MEKIVFLDRATIAPQIKIRSFSFPHELVSFERTSAAQVIDRTRDATIIINNKVNLDSELLAQLPKLKLIAVAATGTNCVDVEYCAKHGISVTNIRGYAVNTVPEHTFALILALQRNVVAFREDVIAGEWQKSGQFCFFSHSISDLANKRLGIIGRGALGQSVAALGRAFGMEILFAAHKGVKGSGPPYTPWEEVLETSDVITLHCPLVEQTRGMIAYPEFLRMRRRPILINTARGGLVVESDLEKALDEGLIRGAGIDVTSPEPPPMHGVLMRLSRKSNVIVTPHIAWASDEAQQTLADQLIDNIEKFIVGEPTNLVTDTASLGGQK